MRAQRSERARNGDELKKRPPSNAPSRAPGLMPPSLASPPALLAAGRAASRRGAPRSLLPARASRAFVPEPAERRELLEVADCFVEGYFLDGRPDSLDAGAVRRLAGATLRDLESRYGGGRATAGERCLLLVRDGDETVVGCVGLQLQPFLRNTVLRGSLRSNPPEEAVLRPVVSNLAVLPRARRRGLAAKLMARCEAQCREWGCQECILLVESTNARAQKLYSKLGYKRLPGGDEQDAPSLRVENGKVRMFAAAAASSPPPNAFMSPGD
jgi:GNAT superfamily N-acetyltransferase